MHIARVSSKGRIVIPKELRKRYRLERDTDVVIFEERDALVLRRSTDVQRILRDEFAPLLLASESALKEPWDNQDDDVWNDA